MSISYKEALLKHPSPERRGSKELSQKQVDKIIDILCKDIPKVKQNIKLGSGTEGDVYEWCVSAKNCDYVVKIQRYPEALPKRYLAIALKEQEKTNVANFWGFSPKIYKVQQCPDEKVILQLMDKVKGNTLGYYLIKDMIDGAKFNLLLDTIKEMHDKAQIYHGDLGPRNIFFNGTDKFTFIDFNIRKQGYKNHYDYATILYYLPYYYEESKAENKVEVYKFFVYRIVEMMISYGIEESDYLARDIIKFYVLNEKITDPKKFLEFLEEMVELSLEIYTKYSF